MLWQLKLVTFRHEHPILSEADEEHPQSFHVAVIVLLWAAAVPNAEWVYLLASLV